MCRPIGFLAILAGVVASSCAHPETQHQSGVPLENRHQVGIEIAYVVENLGGTTARLLKFAGAAERRIPIEKGDSVRFLPNLNAIAVWGWSPIISLISMKDYNVTAIDLSELGVLGDHYSWSHFGLDESRDGSKLLIWLDTTLTLWEVDLKGRQCRQVFERSGLEKALGRSLSLDGIGYGAELTVNKQTGSVAFNIPSKSRHFVLDAGAVKTGQYLPESEIIVFSPSTFTFKAIGTGLPKSWLDKHELLVSTLEDEVSGISVISDSGVVLATLRNVCSPSSVGKRIIVRRVSKGVPDAEKLASEKLEIYDEKLVFLEFGPTVGDFQWSLNGSLAAITLGAD